MSATNKLLNEEYVLPPFGLANTNSICWMNSFLQMLFSLSAFNETVLELQPECSCNAVSKEYLELLLEWKSGGSIVQDKFTYAGSNVSIAFTALASALYKKLQIGTKQECVDEAFTIFMDIIKIPRLSHLFESSYECSIHCTNCKNVVSVKRDNGIKIEMFNSATPLATEVDFRDYILHHVSIGDTFTCEKCYYKMRNFDRIERVKMLRECIVIVFNKYYNKEMKWFPPKMEFKSISGPAIKYKLCAKIEHSGNMHGGHYYMHAMRNNKWYCFNDTSVSEGNATPTINTYMIAYHMV